MDFTLLYFKVCFKLTVMVLILREFFSITKETVFNNQYEEAGLI